MPSSMDNVHIDGYRVWVSPDHSEVHVCYNTTRTTVGLGFWGQDPITVDLPFLYRQISLMIVLTGTISFILRPLNQPFLVSSIIAGILLGPSIFGASPAYLATFFPFSSVAMLETFTNLGLVYYMFLIGLEMNLLPILSIKKKSIIISFAGIVIPGVIGFASYGLIGRQINNKLDINMRIKSAFVWGIILTATNLPDLTRILAKLKLLRTEIGRTALASAFISDITTWFFIIIVLAIAHDQITRLLILTTLFAIVFMFVVRPVLSSILHKIEKRGEYRETHVQFVLWGVLLCGFTTDAMGLGSIVGGFVFGFILPSGQLAAMVKERIEKIMCWLIIPMYCLINGLRTNIPYMVPDGKNIYHLILFFFASWSAKFLSTFLVSTLCKLEPEDAVSLGVLMNTKGLMAIVALNISRDAKFMDIESFTVMVVSTLLMTFSVPPLIKIMYKPRKRILFHKWRSIEMTRRENQLKLLVCTHSMHHVRGMINLLQVSYATTRQVLTQVFAVHLIELTANTSSALLIMHDAYRTNSVGPSRANAKAESDKIIEAFENFEEECDNVYVEPLTALSPYSTMHVDICSIAEDKCATIIILPFHVQKISEEEPEEVNSSIRDVNQRVLEYPPCSVGVLVNRGFGRFHERIRFFVTFFIGGRDDREALSYAVRMAARPEVHLTVVRINPGEGAIDATPVDYPHEEAGILNILENHERQKELDDEFINEFRFKTMSNQSINYFEEVANGGHETLTIIRKVMVHSSFELCILGRAYQRISPLVYGISDLIEYPELGSLGDAVFSSDFALNTSLLIVQQYVGITARASSLRSRIIGTAHGKS